MGTFQFLLCFCTEKKQNDPEGSFSVYRKASQSFASADAKDV